MSTSSYTQTKVTGFVIESTIPEIEVGTETAPFWIDWDCAVQGRNFVYWTNRHQTPRILPILRRPRLGSDGRLFLEVRDDFDMDGNLVAPRIAMICLWKTDAPARDALRIVFPVSKKEKLN